MSVTDARRVDDHDPLSTNPGINDADFAGARLEAVTDLLLLGCNQVDELFGRKGTT